jgi:hypothetical protein
MIGETPMFPTIDFYDVFGNVHRIYEIKEFITFDGDKKITYTMTDGEEISFVIKER